MAKRVGWNLLAIVGVVTVGQLVVFHHYNNLFTSGTPAASAKTKTVANSTANVVAQKKVTQSVQKEVDRLQALNYHFVTVSPEQDYVTYLDSQNILHIEDLKTHREISAAKNPYKVQYVSWIEDKTASTVKVFVGEQIQPGNLELKTVDVSDGTQTPIAHFSGLSPEAAIQKITFSFDTNDIYILVNTSSTSAIYHIGTMKHVTQVPIGGRFIKNIALSLTGDRLYFEDRLNGSYNVLYFDDQYVPHRVQLNAALVGVSGNDVYYGDINKSGLVTTVYKMDRQGNSTMVQTLDTPTVASDIDITDNGQIQIDSSNS